MNSVLFDEDGSQAGLRTREPFCHFPTSRSFPGAWRSQCHKRRSFSHTAAGQFRILAGFPFDSAPLPCWKGAGRKPATSYYQA